MNDDCDEASFNVKLMVPLIYHFPIKRRNIELYVIDCMSDMRWKIMIGLIVTAAMMMMLWLKIKQINKSVGGYLMQKCKLWGD